MKNPRQPEKRGNADGSKKVWEHRQSTGSGKPRQYPMFPTPSGMGNLIGQVCRSNLPDLWIPVTTRLPIEIVCFSYVCDKDNNFLQQQKVMCRYCLSLL